MINRIFSKTKLLKTDLRNCFSSQYVWFRVYFHSTVISDLYTDVGVYTVRYHKCTVINASSLTKIDLYTPTYTDYSSAGIGMNVAGGKRRNRENQSGQENSQEEKH